MSFFRKWRFCAKAKLALPLSVKRGPMVEAMVVNYPPPHPRISKVLSLKKKRLLQLLYFYYLLFFGEKLPNYGHQLKLEYWKNILSANGCSLRSASSLRRCRAADPPDSTRSLQVWRRSPRLTSYISRWSQFFREILKFVWAALGDC